MEERPKQTTGVKGKNLEKERMQRTGENIKINPTINILSEMKILHP